MRLPRLERVRSLPRRAYWRVNTALSTVGERHGIDWLTYNPLQMWAYHLQAREAAPCAVTSMLETFPDAVTYVDVGAGSGAFAAEVRRRGGRVIACERSRAGRAYSRVQGVDTRSFDLELATPSTLPGGFGLAYCFEVAEHLSPSDGDRLVGFLCELSPTILFSASQPGQGGLGHINEQPPEYWMERFGSHGYYADEEATRVFLERTRSCASAPLWLRENPRVFREGRDEPEAEGRRGGAMA